MHGCEMSRLDCWVPLSLLCACLYKVCYVIQFRCVSNGSFVRRGCPLKLECNLVIDNLNKIVKILHPVYKYCSIE